MTTSSYESLNHSQLEFIPIYGTRCLQEKETPAMAGGQCTGLKSRPRS